MNTLNIPVNPTTDRNVKTLAVDFHSFDPVNGMNFSVILYNPNGIAIDKTYVDLGGDRWQNWPVATTLEYDSDYIKETILIALGFTEFIPVIAEPTSPIL